MYIVACSAAALCCDGDVLPRCVELMEYDILNGVCIDISLSTVRNIPDMRVWDDMHVHAG